MKFPGANKIIISQETLAALAIEHVMAGMDVRVVSTNWNYDGMTVTFTSDPVTKEKADVLPDSSASS